MSWQAFSWSELHARAPRIPERLLPAISIGAARFHEALVVIGAFLTPFAVMEAALGCWRLCADLGWAGTFFIDHGLLSHWQVWFVLAAFTQATSVFLNRTLAKQSALLGRSK